MQQAISERPRGAHAGTDMVRDTAEHLVERVGRDAAIRMCRSNMWLGVLAEIERSGEH